MRIKLGPQIPIPAAKSRIPNNEGMSESASQEIEYMAQSANQSYTNALAVDGVDFMLWRRKNEGHRCTCKTKEIVADESGTRYEEYSEKKPGEETIRVRGSWDRRNNEQNIWGQELGVDVGKVVADDNSGEQKITNLEEIDKDEVEAFLNGPVNPSLLSSGENTTACGICFSTGFSNGYSLFKGQRLVLDSVNVVNSRGVLIDRDTRPFTFKFVDDRGFVEWRLRLPKYIMAGVSANVRNNLSPVQNVNAKIKTENSDWQPLSKATIAQYAGQLVDIRVERNVNETKNFTHVEIVLQFSAWDKTQVPQLSSGGGGNAPESTYNVELNLPPSIPDIDSGDVIFDYKYKKTWRISDYTDYKTSQNTILSWTVNVRSLTTMDTLSLLKTTLEPTYGLAFSGLDNL